MGDLSYQGIVVFLLLLLLLLTSLFFLIAELNPKNDFIKLTTNTEVIVAPKVRQMAKPADLASSQLSTSDDQKSTPQTCLRNLPDTFEHNNVKTTDTMTVLIHPDDLCDIELDVVRLSKVIPGYENITSRKHGASNSNENTDDKENPLADGDHSTPTKAVYAQVQISNSIPRHHVLLGSVIKSTLDLGDFDIIK
jgi:peroxin-1